MFRYHWPNLLQVTEIREFCEMFCLLMFLLEENPWHCDSKHGSWSLGLHYLATILLRMWYLNVIFESFFWHNTGSIRQLYCNLYSSIRCLNGNGINLVHSFPAQRWKARESCHFNSNPYSSHNLDSSKVLKTISKCH